MLLDSVISAKIVKLLVINFQILICLIFKGELGKYVYFHRHIVDVRQNHEYRTKEILFRAGSICGKNSRYSKSEGKEVHVAEVSVFFYYWCCTLFCMGKSHDICRRFYCRSNPVFMGGKQVLGC